MNEEQQQPNEEDRQMKIHIKNEQQQHKISLEVLPMKVTSLGVIDLLKNYYRSVISIAFISNTVVQNQILILPLI